VLSPLSRLIGHPDVDVWNHAWGPWWYWRTLGTGTIPWDTPLLAAPDGGVLWYIDPLGALAGAPLVGVLGVVGAYNAVMFAWAALASVAGRDLARALGAEDGASWVAAVAVACSPYVLSELHDGVSEAAGVHWSVFALAAAWRAVEAPSARRWAIAGAWLGVAATGTWYLAFGAATVVATWAALRRRPGVLLAGVVALALAAPVLAVVRASVDSPRSLVMRAELGHADRELLLSHNAVDPRAFVAPLGFQSVDLTARGEAFRHSSYVGLVALALALAARRRDALAGAVPAAVLGLGPYLWWGGEWVRTAAGDRLGLPFLWVSAVLPAAAATHAQRVAWPALAVVAGLAAVGASRLSPRARAVAVALVAADALLASPWPLARAEELDVRAHTAIRAASREGIVLDLPAEVGNTMTTSRYFVYQAYSDHPVPYRPDARAGTSSLLGVPAFAVLALPSMSRPEHRDRVAATVSSLSEVDLGVLVQKGVRWVVVHRELERGEQGLAGIERQLVAWFGQPTVTGTHAVWETRAGRGAVLR
jgi:hypothetical protein